MSDDQHNLQNTADFRALILEKIENLNNSMARIEKSGSEFKEGIWGKINDHHERIVKLEGSLGILIKLAWCIALSSIGIILTAVFNILLKNP